ncbi:MAG: ribose-phosphate pyrophosphokinase [Lachnospiraceae bacterium]|nr:ribose-phosphate pyrophosphokinase [Lachnospiraceae bacterium]MBR4768821.1 ribose-phosphate pyrophosphokinase [Lachnospiraceae bacterium]
MAELKLQTIPAGKLGIIAMENIKPLAEKVDAYIASWRSEREKLSDGDAIHFQGYQRDSYLIDAKTPRFGSGEGKGQLFESVRGLDIYIMVDVLNYSLTYKLCGQINHMSPDDHYQDLKRIIGAIQGKANRITVIMPFLYESRQHRRTARESLDCAAMLQELFQLGIDDIITFDAHDPRVQNAIPDKGFENVACTYQFIKKLVKGVPDIHLDSDHLMIISPDEGGMSRAVTFGNYLNVNVGMFYKRRDYTRIVNGTNPIIAHEYLGNDLNGKDALIVDDMISSGGSMLEVAKALKDRGARRVYCAGTFGLFTNGLEKFDKAYEEGYIDYVLTTNLTYLKPELFERPYYLCVDLSKYIALIIDNLNHNNSLADLLSPTDRINKFLAKHRECYTGKD